MNSEPKGERYLANRDKQIAAASRWNREHPERFKANNRRWRQKYPGYGKEWYAKNAEKMRAYGRKWSAANRGKLAAYRLRQRLKDPEKYRNYQRRYRMKHRARFSDMRRRRKIPNYQPGTFDRLMREQDGRCAICKKIVSDRPKVAHLDHNHKTGQVRGVLCSRCNLILPCVEVDTDGRWIEKAKAYLERYGSMK